MYNATEQFAELNKVGVAQATKLAALALENTEKLARLNLSAAKVVLAQGVEGATATTSVKDVQDLLSLRAKFAEKGIVFPDHFVFEELPQEKEDVKGFWIKILAGLKPGVTELYIHAAKPTEELQAITGSWRTRSAEFEVFTNDPEVKKLVGDQNIIRIGYRALRELQRTSGKKEPK